MEFNQKLFGQRIQEARMSRGITQEEFAEEIDVSSSYYQKLERGVRTCSLDILVSIAEQEENKRLCGNCYCQDYNGYIYVNEIGEIIKPGFLTSHFASVLKANNMPRIRFHDLRHTCASLLFAQGVSLKEIQAWLGHSTIGTTANIYTHLDENNKLSSANAILSILHKK